MKNKQYSIPDRNFALKLLESVNLASSIIQHSIQVANKALEIADRLKNIRIDRKLIETGGLLHDIGRSRSHGFDHGLIGASILKGEGISPKIFRICETHILGGIDKDEAKELGLPEKDYLPYTIEEKIICLADKYIKGTSKVSINERFDHWFSKYGESDLLNRAKKRVVKIQNEIEEIHN